MTLLLFAGGVTTSIQAGMAFLDWPLSNGSLNPEGWTHAADQLAEHSHRLLGMKMGLLSIALAVFCGIFESRKIVRRLALALVGIIIFQGVLGGMRVLLDQQNLHTETNVIAHIFVILHACGAQITLCTMVTLVILLSRGWIEGEAVAEGPAVISLRRWAKFAVVALLGQLLLGAMVRHLKAALIFGDHFPLLTGDITGWESFFPARITLHALVHYLHRVWAVIVVVIVFRFITKAWSIPKIRRDHGFWIGLLSVLLVLQVALGAMVVWTIRNPHAATVHTLCGASILAITWGLTVRVHRRNKEAGA